MYRNTDPAKLVRALIEEAPRGADMPPETSFLPRGRTVTVSRDCGAKGEEIARRLASCLGVQCFDRELLTAMVHEAEVDHALLEKLDERVRSLMDEVVREVLSSKHFGTAKFRATLLRVVLGIASTGGVIVGRGANLILARREVYRVRITGTPLVCAQQLAEKEHTSVQIALQSVEKVNAERAEFIRYHFARDINTPSDYDMMLNSDQLKVDDAARILTYAMQTAGFTVPTASRMTCGAGR